MFGGRISDVSQMGIEGFAREGLNRIRENWRGLGNGDKNDKKGGILLNYNHFLKKNYSLQ